jgi:dihydroflavonol-4-reductase
MRALVTGATGFIGSHLADFLLSKGFDVRCIIRKTSNLRWLKGKPVETVVAALNDKESIVKALEDVDYVFHVAGLTFARNEDEFMKGNSEGTKNLIEAVVENDQNIKRFLFVSSQTVAGPAKSINRPVTEDMPYNPLTAYGRSKKAAEEEVLKLKDKIPITVVRAPAVYGPRDTAIYSVFKTVKMGLGTMVGMKPKYLSLIHSSDLVRGIVDAALSENTIGEIYFVSSEEFYTWNELIPLIGRTLGMKFVLKIKLPHFLVLTVAGISEFLGKLSSKPPVFNYEKGIDFIQDFWICSVEKAKRDFGYSQEMSIEDGIRNTIEWYKANNWL